MTAIVWRCPNCTTENEIDCPVVEANLTYGISSVPLETAGRLDGSAVVCASCKERYLIQSQKKRINLDLVPASFGEESNG